MHDRMINHLKKTIPFIIITILAAGGVETFYRLTFTRLLQGSPAPTIETEVSDVVATPVKSVERRQLDYQAILTRNLFGPPPEEIKPAAVKEEPVDPATLAATSLELSLLGTITGPSKNRRAILLDKRTRLQNIYYQGDMVQSALIKDIQRQQIILNVNGTDEILVPETTKKNPSTAMNPNIFFQIPPGTEQVQQPEINQENVEQIENSETEAPQ